MALPHHLTITGSGFDAGEFFYGCNAAVTDGPPGSGSRGLSPNEDALSENFNRAAFALAENDEYVYEKITRDLAITEILAGTISGGDTNTITITPSGGSGKFPGDPTSSVYVGGADYSNTQEFRDLLVQLMNSDYEDIIDQDTGEPLICTAIQRADTHVSIVGEGFWSSTDVEFIFSHDILDTQVYRLTVAVNTTVESLPEDSLINTDIRGMNEAESESTFKSWFVCAVDSTTGPADYIGVDAIQKAIDGLGNTSNITLYVRAGSYTVEAIGGGTLNITNSGITIIGEGSETSTSNSETELVLSGGDDLQFTGYGVRLENLKISSASTGSQLQLFDDQSSVSRCKLDGVGLIISSNLCGSIDSCIISVDGSGIIFDNCSSVSVRDCSISTSGTSTAPTITFINTLSSRIEFSNCSISSAGGSGKIGVKIDRVYNSIFNNCRIVSSSGSAIVYGYTVAAGIEAVFNNCEVQCSNTDYGTIMPAIKDVAQKVRMTFNNCNVKSTATSWYQGPFVQLLAERNEEYLSDNMLEDVGYINIQNTRFEDYYCKGVNTATNPPSQVAGGTVAFPIFELKGVIGQGLIFDRTGLTYDIQDSSWIKMSECFISGVKILYPECTGGHQLDSTLSDWPGLFYVENSHLSNVRFAGWLGSGSTDTDREWTRPLMSINGGNNSRQVCVVDTVDIIQLFENLGSAPHEWETSAGTAQAIIDVNYATLKNFMWDTRSDAQHYNQLASTAQLNALVRVGPEAIVEDCRIYHSQLGLELSFVFMRTGVKNHIHRNNVFVDNCGATEVNMESVVKDASGYDIGWITDNHFESSLLNPPTTSNGTMIDCGTSANMTITGNYLFTGWGTAHDAIHVDTQYNVVTGNHLDGDGSAPDIDPVTVVGYSDNNVQS